MKMWKEQCLPVLGVASKKTGAMDEYAKVIEEEETGTPLDETALENLEPEEDAAWLVSLPSPACGATAPSPPFSCLLLPRGDCVRAYEFSRRPSVSPEPAGAIRARPEGRSSAFHLFEDRKRSVEPVGADVMTRNGHNTDLPIPGSEWILDDTYPDLLTREQTPYPFHVPTDRRYDLDPLSVCLGMPGRMAP